MILGILWALWSSVTEWGGHMDSKQHEVETELLSKCPTHHPKQREMFKGELGPTCVEDTG